VAEKNKTLRAYIREQLQRNMYTVNTSPHTFDDIEGYDIEIVADVNEGYLLTVKFEEKLLAPTQRYKDYEEAHHQARMIVDKHRVQVMDAT